MVKTIERCISLFLTKTNTQSTVYILTMINDEASEIVNYMTPEAELFMIRRFQDIGQTD